MSGLPAAEMSATCTEMGRSSAIAAKASSQPSSGATLYFGQKSAGAVLLSSKLINYKPSLGAHLDARSGDDTAQANTTTEAHV